MKFKQKNTLPALLCALHMILTMVVLVAPAVGIKVFAAFANLCLAIACYVRRTDIYTE